MKFIHGSLCIVVEETLVMHVLFNALLYFYRKTRKMLLISIRNLPKKNLC